jgi:hypothetical protein
MTFASMFILASEVLAAAIAEPIMGVRAVNL